MLLLYILLLGALAAFTAYARHLQSTVITLEQQIPGASGRIATPGQPTLRTLALVLGWPAALGVGMLFIAWWKAAALVAGAFLRLVPVAGLLMPRPMSAHHLERIRSDLERRIARSGKDGRDTDRLRHILGQIASISPRHAPRQPSARPSGEKDRSTPRLRVSAPAPHRMKVLAPAGHIWPI